MAEQSALEPFRKLVATFKGHLFGIKTFFEQGTITNGVLESLNSKVQLAKRRARGYANVNNFTRHVLAGWTYVMLGTVELSDTVEISVERTGLCSSVEVGYCYTILNHQRKSYSI